jgi:hypothetical protein
MGIIYRSSLLEVLFKTSQSSPSDALCLTFNGLGSYANGMNVWGENFLTRRNVDVLGFMTTGPNWFPAAEMIKAVSAVQAARGSLIPDTYGRVLAYGSSMGGYAALKYGKTLGAHAALAICPHFSIDPADVGNFDKHFTRYFDSRLNTDMRIAGHDLC